MKYKLIIPAVGLCLIMTACSLSSPRQSTTTPPSIPQTPARTVDTAVAAPTRPAPTQTPQSIPEMQPVKIQGTFTFSNNIILTYYIENAVAMMDMYGFVKRDRDWPIPISSQSLGFLKIDPKAMNGIFDLNLPAQPNGKLVSVNPGGKEDKGLQVFSLAYSPNLAGGPYSEGDDAEHGWPAYLASVKTDSENQNEVTGGKLVIWSPDDQQSFPTDFGPDGLLFTQDDPVALVPQGYSVVDLDKKPFLVLRDPQIEMTLYEPEDAALKDYSALSYSEAFEKMFAAARKEYAFNGIEGKQPDWDLLHASLAPRIEEAQHKKDAEAYFSVLRDFTLAFQDGHVGLNGGEIGQKFYSEQYAGGYGFAVRKLDDGRVMVVFVLPEGPAEKAGMKTGAVISKFNGKPVDEAIQAVKPSGPASIEANLRYEQARYLVRAPLDTKATVIFTNPDGAAAQTAELTAVAERESISVTSPYRNTDPNALPVEYVVSSAGIGYVRISTNYDDLNLIIRLFKRALTKFKENNLETLVIDMRANSGGSPLGLAGFLTDQEIPMGQLQYYSDKTGKFEPQGPFNKITPNEEQFSFNKMFLLVDQACASACELESYGFSKVPGMVVVGEYPTSGTEAEVSRGQFMLPEGMKMQIPTGRFILPDGSIFLEGKGVMPTERVPVDENSVRNDQDPLIRRVLELAQ